MIFFIIGYMGAGKSSVGREVARRTGIRFADMDKEIEKMHRMTVSEIFANQGERVFRKSERTVLEQLAEEDGDVIVSAGGGTPCQGDNIELMNRTGKTIYLKLSPAKLVSRLKPGQERRPILTGMNKEQMLEFIERALPEREPCYLKASMIIDCDRLSDDSICSHVTEYVKHFTE